jgi:2-polyprenyl-3-methyl-5-hydroxy-6-metoxy-1,4-benzoquinol methylase
MSYKKKKLKSLVKYIYSLIVFLFKLIGYKLSIKSLHKQKFNLVKIDKIKDHNQTIQLLKYSDHSYKTDEFVDMIKKGDYKLDWRDCALCKSKDHIIIGRSSLSFKWTLCNDCGFVQLSLGLSQSSLNNFYISQQYQSVCMGGLDDETHFSLEKNVMSRVFTDIVEILETKSSDSITIAEIGCGSGGILMAFQKKGFKTLGFDIDPEKIAYGIKKGVKNINIADCLDDTFDIPRCDYLILSNVLEHIYAPRDFISRIYKKLKNTSTIIMIDVPNIKGVHHYGETTADFFHVAHLNYFSQSSLQSMLLKENIFVECCFDRGAAITLICSFYGNLILKKEKIETIFSLNFSNRRN